jgi:hypothetical protein
VSGYRGFRLSWLSLGLLTGAAVTAILLVILADLVSSLPPWRVLGSLSVAGAMGLADVAGRRSLTFPRRQTYSGAVSFAGQRTGHLIWGIDIGLGFTTYRASRLYWSGLVLLATGVPGILCLAGTLVYALALLRSIRKNRFGFVPESSMIHSRRRSGLAGVTVAVGLLTAVGLGA